LADRNIELDIRPLATQTRVRLEGEDISNRVRRVEVVVEVGQPTRVTLEFVRGVERVAISGYLHDESAGEEQP
jgi:hypothetical protein